LTFPDGFDVKAFILQDDILELPHPTTHAKIISFSGDKSNRNHDKSNRTLVSKLKL